MKPIEIDVTGGIKVGGFDYRVDMGHATQRMLLANDNVGECDCRNMVIRIRTDDGPQLTSKTFIHEVIEAVNHVFCADKIEHERIQQLSFGIHQVMESLGVRFGNDKSLD